MIEEDYKHGWKQHFPTYHFDDRDIALEEYKVATKNLESEERVFLNASNFTLVSSAALGSLLVGTSNQLMKIFDEIINPNIITLILSSIIISFSFISLKYFSDRQKAIAFSARKTVILRRMLGLSYGKIQLLLPNWRVEGADQPLAIKLFPGWFTYVAYPFWIISIISTSVMLFLAAVFLKQNQGIINSHYNLIIIFSTGLFWTFLSAWTYRFSLLDTHERSRLLFYKLIAKTINIKLMDNFEYIIYRAKLACYENERLNISTKNLKRFLVFIEDKEFYSHSGISYKAIFRGLLGILKIKPRSGGSTIIQQLVRTLFIKDFQKRKRRKLIELSLAPWMSDILPKENILDIYLASVRFEKGCFGVLEAMKYYWGNPISEPNNAQAFFLIERVSNIKSKLLVNKIIETARSAKSSNLMTESDLHELAVLYSDAVNSGKIFSTSDELSNLNCGLIK
ncbi:biosynthetic peptidoglycan transglycosylase [Aeromonas dhakensis]|uniref:biosynthetic peptidoglycan transglycosylase n=1 Tax=Aeromonas dhakensis TaxID=196024 RepID=UPI0028907859|nr:transglycosylase domain-containing protein [Aeromonas dhakensis]